MVDYGQHFNTRQTPQSEPIPGRADMVANNAGGYGWAVDDWTRLTRWLVLGSASNTYYQTAHKLTVENAEAVIRCLKADGPRTVARIVEISEAGRAPRNDQAVFALALACAPQWADAATRRAAFEALPRVCRTGTHLLNFCRDVEGFRGWGRGLRRAVAGWFVNKPADDLALQLVKYRQRDGWAMRDVLRVAHPQTLHPARQALLLWATQGPDALGQPRTVERKAEGSRTYAAAPTFMLPALADGYQRALGATSEAEIVRLIADYRLPWEAIDTRWLKSPDVWAALLPHLPVTATIRNLGRMTANGLLAPLSDAARVVTERLTNAEALKRARVHPIALLTALLTYAQGQGDKGSLTWTPVQRVIDALDSAFYLAFGAVEPTGKRLVLAVDVSGSMGNVCISGIMGLTPRKAAAAMALVTANVEKEYEILGFSHTLVPLPISPRMRLDDVERVMRQVPMGGTDCALPMMWALGYDGNSRYTHSGPQHGGYRKVRAPVDVDGFVIYTDEESWFGPIHPAQALQQYRREIGHDARLVSVALTATQYSIADPADAHMLDVVGMDTATPGIISEFLAGRL